MKDRHELSIAQAWHTANFGNARKLPGLASVLRRSRGVGDSNKLFTAGDAEARALLMGMGAKKNGD